MPKRANRPHRSAARRCALALVLSTGALLGPLPAGAGAVSSNGARPAARHSLLSSRELWATVDVCNPPDQQDTVGVRGSMPSDGNARDAMYMRFQLQYLEAKTGAWVDLHDGDSGFIAIGNAKTARQGGWSVQLMVAKGASAYTIRGLVTFQWRHDGAAVHQAVRTTQAGHHSLADADPAGYSAAECVLG